MFSGLKDILNQLADQNNDSSEETVSDEQAIHACDVFLTSGENQQPRGRSKNSDEWDQQSILSAYLSQNSMNTIPNADQDANVSKK